VPKTTPQAVLGDDSLSLSPTLTILYALAPWRMADKLGQIAPHFIILGFGDLALSVALFQNTQGRTARWNWRAAAKAMVTVSASLITEHSPHSAGHHHE
jgi:hypothetical protein